MRDDAAFHEGYRRALEDLMPLLERLRKEEEDLAALVREIRERIEAARCSSSSSMAANASGHAGY